MTIPPYSPRISDDSAFWVSIAAPKVRLFCNPFEQLSGQRWHEAYLYDLWDVPEMLRQHAKELMHSSSSMRQKSDEPVISSLFFKITDDVFVFGDLDYAGEGLLSFWAAAAPPHRKRRTRVINSNRGVSSRPSGLNSLIIYCQDQPPFALALRSVDLPGADPMLDKP
jgi:hypothetical protein